MVKPVLDRVTQKNQPL